MPAQYASNRLTLAGLSFSFAEEEEEIEMLLENYLQRLSIAASLTPFVQIV